MKTIFIFTLYLLSVPGESTNEVTSNSGGTVKIKCKYKEGFERNKKYFCKRRSSACPDQIKTEAKHTWVHEGRFALYDDTSAKIFWVLMRNLTVEDSGTYQCGVDIKAQIDTLTPVELKINKELYYIKTINVTGSVGETVNISCSYPESHRSDPKILCKGKDIAICTYNKSGSRRWTNERRVSLYDDRTNQTLTVTIRKLTEQDSGEYWCGTEYGHGYNVYFTLIYLRITAFPVLAVYSSIGAGLVLMTAGAIIAVYCRIKRKGPETVTQSREFQTNEDYVNISAFQQDKSNQSESVYQNVDPKINHYDLA